MLVSVLPAMIAMRLIGASCSRASVPSRRPSSKVEIPNWTVNDGQDRACSAAHGTREASRHVERRCHVAAVRKLLRLRERACAAQAHHSLALELGQDRSKRRCRLPAVLGSGGEVERDAA
jgi:hypothetical protein